jgi:hypothetical protein
MKAVELNIVLEDDDGKMYVRHYAFDSIDEGRTDALMESIRGFVMQGGFSSAVVGPVLRKATEVRGRYYDDGEADSIEVDNGEWSDGMLENMLPDECSRRTDSKRGAMFDYRITVEAVRAPDPEQVAKAEGRSR